MTLTPAKTELTKIVRDRRLSQARRSELQAEISRFMLVNSRAVRAQNFKEICSSDLGLLFQITDETFFDGTVGRLCEQRANRPLAFRLSTRMTSAGGMTTMQSSRERNPVIDYEIAIATTPLFSTFKVEKTAIVSGVVCRSRLEALQRIMEHEMVHLIELLLWNDSNCAAAPFKRIVRRFFGHTESNHQLLTPRDIARKRMGISEGDLVSFSTGGHKVTGHVNRITKRATILVQAPNGSLYDDGKRYQKYYVPLNRLKRA